MSMSSDLFMDVPHYFLGNRAIPPPITKILLLRDSFRGYGAISKYREVRLLLAIGLG